jgi:HEAT repeat protein
MPERVRGLTAFEALERLHGDPDWVAAGQARQREMIAIDEQLRREQQPLLEDLAASGVIVTSVWDLANSPGPYKAALPILLAHLERQYSDRILEGIARALAVKDARPVAWDKLLTMVKTVSLPEAAASAAMVALSAMARPKDLATLVGLIRDRRLGSKRIFLVRNLMRSKRPEARTALLNLRDDPDLRAEILVRLNHSCV